MVLQGDGAIHSKMKVLSKSEHLVLSASASPDRAQDLSESTNSIQQDNPYLSLLSDLRWRFPCFLILFVDECLHKIKSQGEKFELLLVTEGNLVNKVTF